MATLDRSHVRSSRQEYWFGWGTSSRKLAGPAIAVADLLRYTMTPKDAVQLCGLIRSRTTIPLHYEGWKHFRQGREAMKREFAGAPDDIRQSLRWLPIGTARASKLTQHIAVIERTGATVGIRVTGVRATGEWILRSLLRSAKGP